MSKLKLAKELAELYIKALNSKKIERNTCETIRMALLDAKDALTREERLKFNCWAEKQAGGDW